MGGKGKRGRVRDRDRLRGVRKVLVSRNRSLSKYSIDWLVLSSQICFKAISLLGRNVLGKVSAKRWSPGCVNAAGKARQK